MNHHCEPQEVFRAAIEKIQYLEMLYGDCIPWAAINEGFYINGEKILLASKANGIFKPRQLAQGLLSIKTTEPRKGRSNIYRDQELDEGYFRYSLQDGDPHGREKKGRDNKHLRKALENGTPFIYFHAVAEAKYKAIWPCLIANIKQQEDNKWYCEVCTSIQTALPRDGLELYLPSEADRRYSVQQTLVRLHQARFRESVLKAYDYRCAISRLPIVRLLEAAHITPDSDDDGIASVSNGIALSRIHHVAYDSNMLGISPDYKIVVSQELLVSKDGKILESIVDSHGKYLFLPKESSSQPDRDRLKARFELFMNCH